MPKCPTCGEPMLDDRHYCTAQPEQPDGIQEDSNDYPNPTAAAHRVNAWLSEWGDGLIEVLNGQPLYARDLASLARHALTITPPERNNG